MNDGLRLKADDALLLEVGYYLPVYDFDDLETFQQQLIRIKAVPKSMLRVAGASGDLLKPQRMRRQHLTTLAPRPKGRVY